MVKIRDNIIDAFLFRFILEDFSKLDMKHFKPVTKKFLGRGY